MVALNYFPSVTNDPSQTNSKGSERNREKHRLRVSGNRVLRIFEPKRDEVTGCRRKLYNEEFYNLYSSPRIIR
jgi:hypothetical protein